ncbi:hypothetical protein D3C85_173340 [compost metagenome]
MSEISKPAGLNIRWASAGDLLDPGASKYGQGWETEIPPRQWFNWIDNRQDEAIAHINQHGIAVWDNATEYQALKSYVQGSDGAVYRAINTTTNVNPVTDGGVNWQALAWFRLANTAEAQGWVSNLTLLSPGRLSDAFKGSNQSLSTNGFQKIPGGLIVQWGNIAAGATTGSTVLPVSFPTAFYTVVITDSATGVVHACAATPGSLSDFSWRLADNTQTAHWVAIGS